eukprot:12715817-Prorocentrum_lima.AAC.1
MSHPSWDPWHFAFTDDNVALLDRFVVYATHLAQVMHWNQAPIIENPNGRAGECVNSAIGEATLWVNRKLDSVVQPPFDDMFQIPHVPITLPGYNVPSHHVYEPYWLKPWQLQFSNAMWRLQNGMGELVAKLEQEEEGDDGDMLPHSPQEALTAAGAETPIEQPLPRTPTQAVPFLDAARPPPRAP